MRYPLVFFVSGAVTLGLFSIISNMIDERDAAIKTLSDQAAIGFIRVPEVEEEYSLKKRSLPSKPDKASLPDVSTSSSNTQTPAVQIPELDIPLPVTGKFDIQGLGLGQMASRVTTDSDAIAMLRIKPDYPRNAARAGKEGWVKLEFTVTEQGSVVNPVVLDARPRRIFDRAAIQAVLKWRFKPATKAGKAYKQKLVQTVEFRLNQ